MENKRLPGITLFGCLMILTSSLGILGMLKSGSYFPALTSWALFRYFLSRVFLMLNLICAIFLLGRKEWAREGVIAISASIIILNFFTPLGLKNSTKDSLRQMTSINVHQIQNDPAIRAKIKRDIKEKYSKPQMFGLIKKITVSDTTIDKMVDDSLTTSVIDYDRLNLFIMGAHLWFVLYRLLIIFYLTLPKVKEQFDK